MSDKNPVVELKLPVIPDIELTATKTAEVISKHMDLSEEKTGEISMAIIESCINAFEHSKTKEIEKVCSQADIIVAAVGIPELVKGDWVKKDAIVIDVGINKTEKGIVGDVAFDEVSKVAKALTPVPGGVGPMTIACLLKNTIDCFKRSQKN